MTSNKTDITIYGATSFVAKHVLRYLMEAVLHEESDCFRLTLSGRNKTKLDSLKENLKNDDDKIDVDTFVAEASDLKALVEMAKRTRIVLNCAGPYALYSTGVVEACAKEGTDYVDFTGEVAWAAEMRLKFGPLAQASGARIVSFCGFDSIPMDMIVFAGVQALREKVGGNVGIQEAKVWYQMYGLPNGGTVQTALDLPIDIVNDFTHVPAGSDSKGRQLRSTPFLLGDPLILTHPKVRHDPASNTMRHRFALGEWINQLLHIDANFSFGISIPQPMASINM